MHFKCKMSSKSQQKVQRKRCESLQPCLKARTGGTPACAALRRSRQAQRPPFSRPLPLSGDPLMAGHTWSGFRRIPTGGISETSKTGARMQSRIGGIKQAESKNGERENLGGIFGLKVAFIMNQHSSFSTSTTAAAYPCHRRQGLLFWLWSIASLGLLAF